VSFHSRISVAHHLEDDALLLPSLEARADGTQIRWKAGIHDAPSDRDRGSLIPTAVRTWRHSR